MVARRLWFPYRGVGSSRVGRGLVWPPPRLVQIIHLGQCRLRGHRWSSWRIETEDWFEYIDEAVPGAMRGCERRCGTIERFPLPS